MEEIKEIILEDGNIFIGRFETTQHLGILIVWVIWEL